MSRVRHKKSIKSLPSVGRRYRELSMGLRLRLNIPLSLKRTQGYKYEHELLSRLDEELTNRDIKIHQLQSALDSAIIALDDWSRSVAPDFYDEEDVEATKERLDKDGKVYYIATVLEKCKESMK